MICPAGAIRLDSSSIPFTISLYDVLPILILFVARKLSPPSTIISMALTLAKLTILLRTLKLRNLFVPFSSIFFSFPLSIISYFFFYRHISTFYLCFFIVFFYNRKRRSDYSASFFLFLMLPSFMVHLIILFINELANWYDFITFRLQSFNNCR